MKFILILIHLCYHTRISEIIQFIKSRDLFLTVLEAGKSNVKELTSGQGLLHALSHDRRQKNKCVRVGGREKRREEKERKKVTKEERKKKKKRRRRRG
jgi:hypothetical protein